MSNIPFDRDLNPRRPMTRKEAQAEAVRRWGPKGDIYYTPHPLDRILGYSFHVGKADGRRQDGIRILGSGDSWEAAFADADRRAEKELDARADANERDHKGAK